MFVFITLASIYEYLTENIYDQKIHKSIFQLLMLTHVLLYSFVSNVHPILKVHLHA